MPVPTMIRNTQDGPTVFSDDVAKVTIEWAGKGDPMGGDVQPVPAAFTDNVQFQRAIHKGLLSIETADDAVQASIDAQRAEWDSRMQRQREAGKQSLDQVSDNDLVQENCIGPSGRGDGICGQVVPVRSATRYDKPPLCAAHQSLAMNFVAEETGRLVGGKPEKAWARVTMGARQTQEP